MPYSVPQVILKQEGVKREVNRVGCCSGQEQ